MTVQVISKVCDCGKGYRSWHDLKCGHCRSKQEERKLVQYHLALEDAKRRLQLEYFRHYVHDVSAPYGDLRVELV